MKYLCISNTGELERQALILLGASSKREDNSKIGFFGSGFKYALATLCRLRAHPIIFSGTEEVRVTTRPETFRGQKYDVIHIDGHKTSITTEAGPQWTAWEAIRDIWANAQDEGGASREVLERAPHGTEGRTTIWIPATHEVELVLSRWNYYFAADRQVVDQNAQVQILSKTIYKEAWIGHGGFRCHEVHAPSVFDYQLRGRVLNESRKLDSTYSAFNRIGGLWATCDSPERIHKMLKEINSSYFEWEILGYHMSGHTLSNAWKAVVKKFPVIGEHIFDFLPDDQKKKYKAVPDSLYRRLQDNFGLDIVGGFVTLGKTTIHSTRDLTEREWAMVNPLLEVLAKSWPKILTYPIFTGQYTNAEGQTIYGLADRIKHRIFLSADGLRRSPIDLAATLYEEYIHLEHGVNDFTREFQDLVLLDLMRQVFGDKRPEPTFDLPIEIEVDEDRLGFGLEPPETPPF